MLQVQLREISSIYDYTNWPFSWLVELINTLINPHDKNLNLLTPFPTGIKNVN